MRTYAVLAAGVIALASFACAGGRQSTKHDPAAGESSPTSTPIHDEARFGDDEKCAARQGESCTFLAWSCWKRGDAACTLKHAQEACELGHQPGCNLAGRVSDLGGEYAMARAFYEKACDGGESTGCLNLGKLYAVGHGVPVDQVRAVAEYKRACAAENAEACGALGVKYLRGMGVQQDDKEAARLLQKSCKMGSSWGCWDLALAYERGIAFKADPVAAESTRRRACDLFGQADAREQRVPSDIADQCKELRSAPPLK